MKTDSIFYQLFQIYPQTSFELLNLPPDTSTHYYFSSVEVKQLAFRLDGVFLPDNPEQPIYFLEVQFQKDDQFYSRFFSEIFLYLHQSKLSNNWQGVVIYPNNQIETLQTERYSELLNSDRVTRIYLDQLAKIDTIGINILKLVVESDSQAINRGKAVVAQVKQALNESRTQQNLLELIETILIYKLPKISRQEIEAMFSLSDLRETKVYQEALEEGIERGIEQGMEQAKLASIPRLLTLGLSVEQIAQALDLKTEKVQQFLSSSQTPETPNYDLDT